MLCSPGAERIFLVQVWKWKTLAFRIPLTIESLIGSSSPRPQMPLALSYFYLWSLSTFTELSCLEHTDIHLGERLGNPQTVSLSAETTDIIVSFSLCLSTTFLSSSSSLFFLCLHKKMQTTSLWCSREKRLMLQGKPQSNLFNSSWHCETATVVHAPPFSGVTDSEGSSEGDREWAEQR